MLWSKKLVSLILSCMAGHLDINGLLQRGGLMSTDEVEKLTNSFTEAKLSEMSGGTTLRNVDQPVKVIPYTDHPPAMVSGYFTQQKFICGKTPAEMEQVLGIFGKLSAGACILQFESALRGYDYVNKAYTYLPDGKEYTPDPNDNCYLPGKGAPQWQLAHAVKCSLIATVKPGVRYVLGAR